MKLLFLNATLTPVEAGVVSHCNSTQAEVQPVLAQSVTVSALCCISLSVGSDCMYNRAVEEGVYRLRPYHPENIRSRKLSSVGPG